MRLLIILFLGIKLIVSSSHARPVSYPGGWTMMLMNDGDKNTVHLHYSPTAKASLGYKFELWRDRDWILNAIQMNNLLKRWNNAESQANLYLKSGFGLAYSDRDVFENETDAAGFISISSDWENRRYFVSYASRYTEAGAIDDFFQQSARFGWAPYIGDYGDLHSWLMLQVEHMPEANDNVTVTPLVRFFKNVHLFEFGVNNRGEVLFNYILRY